MFTEENIEKGELALSKMAVSTGSLQDFPETLKILKNIDLNLFICGHDVIFKLDKSIGVKHILIDFIKSRFTMMTGDDAIDEFDKYFDFYIIFFFTIEHHEEVLDDDLLKIFLKWRTYCYYKIRLAEKEKKL